MLTKQEYCKAKVQEYCNRFGIERKDAHLDILDSSALGVCLDYLGELNEHESACIRDRGGVLLSCVDETTGDVHFLTVREVLSLLPDEVERTNG